MTIKRAMLACKAGELAGLTYPLLASPKLDGIRCLLHPQLGCVTRSFKQIPNKHINQTLKKYSFSCLDGELVTYNNDNSIRTFNEIQSDVMSQDGTPRFSFLVFDKFTAPERPFEERIRGASWFVEDFTCNHPCMQMVPHELIRNCEELERYEQAMVDGGWEGVMTRKPDMPYKEGRSTPRQEGLLKIKRFEDDEGVIVGCTQLHDKDGGPKDTLGALILGTKQWGHIGVGSGFTEQQRDDIWHSHHEYMGRHVTFKYQPSGVKNKPRFPTFLGFRDKRDMS